MFSVTCRRNIIQITTTLHLTPSPDTLAIVAARFGVARFSMKPFRLMTFLFSLIAVLCIVFYIYWNIGIFSQEDYPSSLSSLSSAPFHSSSSLSLSVGVNLYGLLSDACGLGRAARNVMKCLAASQISLTAMDTSTDLVNTVGPIKYSLPDGPNSQTPRRDFLFDIYVHNGDHSNMILKKLKNYNSQIQSRQLSSNGKSNNVSFLAHYRIGLWHWETTSLPLLTGFLGRHYNEIWAPTKFVADAILNTPTFPRTAKVVVLPYGIAEELPLASGQLKKEARSTLYNYTLKVDQLWPAYRKTDEIEKWCRIKSKATIFLVIFDYRSDFNRKNVIGSIAAFEKAVPPSKKDDVGLIIKMDGHMVPAVKGDSDSVLADLMKYNDDRIYLLGGFSSDEDLFNLKRATDCYVSLHRSEGLGLNLLEAIFSGVPTISTAYGGSQDFMNLLYGT